MLVPVFISRNGNNKFSAIAPDFPGCTASGSELGRTITRIHLQLEGRVSEMLIKGESLPEIAGPPHGHGKEPDGVGQFFQIHINLVHLAAVAKHQNRTRPTTR